MVLELVRIKTHGINSHDKKDKVKGSYPKSPDEIEELV